VLTERGYSLEEGTPESVVLTRWRGDDELREQARVRVSQTSMGLAVALKVSYARPMVEGQSPAEDDDLVSIGDALWRIDRSMDAEADAAESELGRAVRQRWRELRIADEAS